MQQPRHTPNLSAVLRRAFAPHERPDAVEWAETYIEDIPYSPIPGRFRIYNSPFLAPILRELTNRRTRKVIISACVQSGKTLAPEIALCWLIANSPAPTLWLDMTDDSARDQSENRLQPLFENCTPVAALLPDKKKRRAREIKFTNGMRLWIAGANNPTNLQRRSICYLFGDETWRWKAGRMAEASARVSAYGLRSKTIFMSQGSESNDDTDRAFRATDRRELCFACPKCGKPQPFRWQNLHWHTPAANAPFDIERLKDSIRLVCPFCGAEFRNTPTMRATLRNSAQFIAQTKPAETGAVGFHWNAIAIQDWSTLVEEYLLAKKHARRGERSGLREFYQKRLAEPWGTDAESAEWETLTGRIALNTAEAYSLAGATFPQEAVFDAERKTWTTAEAYAATGNTRPPRARLRFMTVDVQEASFFWIVRAWSRTGNSRLIARGQTMDIDELDRNREKHSVNCELVYLDCGFRTQQIRRFCAEHGFAAMKGDRRRAWTHATPRGSVERPYSRPIRCDCGNGKIATMFLFSNRAVKDMLAAIRAGGTDVTWQLPADIDSVYLKHLSAEYFDETKQQWICPEKRANHFFDCETMNLAAALMHGIVGRTPTAEK